MVHLPRRAALLVVDVQRGFDHPAWGPRNNPDAEANIARLLGRWRELGSPVYHVRHDSALPASPLRPGQAGNAVKPEAAPAEGEPVYPKSVNSAFIGTTLEQDLRRDRVTAVVVVGLTTNHCVSTTARMAGNLGFATYVASDATATFDRPGLDGRARPAAEVHAAALSDLDGEFATVADTAALLAASRPPGLQASHATHAPGRGHVPEPPKEHRYRIAVGWTGNRGSGTSAYRAYARDHEVRAEGKPAILGSSDPSFRGDPGRWNPEELLVASLSTCHQLWYLHLCADAGVTVTAYLDRAEGVMAEAPGGNGRFTGVVLRPEVTLAPGSDAARAVALHAEAHARCFVANSVNFPVACEPVVRVG